jgi:hypothetical protein
MTVDELKGLLEEFSRTGAGDYTISVEALEKNGSIKSSGLIWLILKNLIRQ